MRRLGERPTRSDDARSAQVLGDSAAIAHSLNRLGSWHINIGQPQEALGQHAQALDIRKAVKDQRGLAEIHELLGMAYYLIGDLVQSTTHYEQAL